MQEIDLVEEHDESLLVYELKINKSKVKIP